MRTVILSFRRNQQVHIDNVHGFNKGFEALMGELGLSRTNNGFNSLYSENILSHKPYTSGDSSVAVVDYTPENEDKTNRHIAMVTVSSRREDTFQDIIEGVSDFYNAHRYENMGFK